MFQFNVAKRKVVRFRGQNKVIGGLTDKDKIAILLYISKEFANVDKEDDLFQTVLNTCKEIFEADNTTLRLYDGEFLVPVKFIKPTEPPRRNLKPGEGYSGTAFVNKNPLIIQDLTNSPQFIDEEEQTKCVMCIPLMQKDEVLGTLSVESDMDNFFITDDLEILEALGSQLTLALSGVRLIEGLMTARAREAAILAQLEWDMKMGRNVQSQILPQDLSPWNGLYFGTYYEPMVEVSGDLYDVVRQGNSITAINIDVSGHGIPAALVTMAIHHHFRRCVQSGLGLSEIMEELGESLRGQLPESTYFTAFIVRIFSDYSYGYINGGHQKMLHIHSDDLTIEELDTKGVPLGILEVRKADYEEKQGKLSPGDLLVLLTDGFSEQKNINREEAGTEGVIDWIIQEKAKLESGNQKLFMKDLSEKFVQRFKEFKGEAPNGDDLSLLMIQCNKTIRDAVPYIKQAKIANSKRNDEEAYALALKAYSIDPSLKENLLFLGKIHYRDAKYLESIKYFSEYIETTGENTAISHFLLGRAYYMGEKIPEAKRSLKKALSCDHSFAKASLLLARCYLKENARPKAIKVLQQGVKSTPNNESLKQSLSRLEDINRKAVV
ncbi:SpoIIE family protein phosphatase [Leptospira sp. GIMC2001]|uniref:SpoIIE family protein phosphatase n=1 Tax=Leptospira sp. GIMC2001 TaxID=1513297 RepID=UPI00234912EA|nr:SpoIIE family protein phosphatase [Leptospira sp. GIMC2001]WCL47975.1 SpoIIE family protein phosphatase [Leptospira sp. GIMC2001]